MALLKATRPFLHALLLAGCCLCAGCLPATAQNHTIAGDVRRLEVASSYVAPRTIQVYLPPGYDDAANRTCRYPVLYLQDGQNVFDGATAFIKGHEWQADESAERLIRAGEIKPLIIVAVPNAGTARGDEYTPTPDAKYGGGKADTYGRFLRWELKPLIDRTFRTRPGARDTSIGGSSLGGLVALHLALASPGVWGRVAVLSPSVWWDNQEILREVAASGQGNGQRVYVDIGTKEPDSAVADARLLRDALVAHGWVPGKTLFYAEGEGDAHNEDAWARRFPQVLRFLFGRSSNTQQQKRNGKQSALASP